MEFADEKRRLYHLAMEQGLHSGYDFTQLTAAPKHLVKKWMTHFFRPPEPMVLLGGPKLVNKFPLGADPEFAFLEADGTYRHAQDLGMNTILPFGCDMAGRQAELRAHPSRFALEVVASMVDALRWIPQFYQTDHLSWVSMPLVAQDGCGGHVHFGRKRPDRELEVEILDRTMQLLLMTKVFDPENKRRNYTKYGQYKDFRLQAHGYEYRALPTWMDSPWKAYFVIVICKLMLHHGVAFIPKMATAHHQLVNLLRLYRSTDDDAAIALAAWHKLGFPVSDERCFRSRWGVEKKMNVMPVKPMNSLYFPLALKPEERTCVELFESLVTGLPLKQRAPVATWKPFELGRDFQSVAVRPHIFEIPNIAQGLVSKYYFVSIDYSQRPDTLQFAGNVGNLNEKAIRDAFSNMSDIRIVFTQNSGKSLYLQVFVPKQITDERERVKQVRRVLSDTMLFPVCKGENILTADWTRWDTPVGKPLEKFYGTVIASVKGQNVPKPAVRQYEEEAF